MDGLNGYMRAVLLKDFHKIYSQQQKGPIMVCCQHLAIFTHNRILSKKVVTANTSQVFKNRTALSVCLHVYIGAC